MNKQSRSTERLVSAAMFAALTLLATSVLKIQTPTFGYIHLGDGLALLSGIFLGPVYGGLAAGLGSALSDLLGGYAVWVRQRQASAAQSAAPKPSWSTSSKISAAT